MQNWVGVKVTLYSGCEGVIVKEDSQYTPKHITNGTYQVMITKIGKRTPPDCYYYKTIFVGNIIRIHGWYLMPHIKHELLKSRCFKYITLTNKEKIRNSVCTRYNYNYEMHGNYRLANAFGIGELIPEVIV